MKIIITVEGGIVQSVQTDEPAEYLLVDLDNEDENVEGEIELYPGDNKVEAFLGAAKYSPESVNEVFERYRELRNRTDRPKQTLEALHDHFLKRIKEFHEATGVRVDAVSANWIVYKDLQRKDAGTYLESIKVSSSK